MSAFDRIRAEMEEARAVPATEKYAAGLLRALEILQSEGEPDLLAACEAALAMLDELFPPDVFTGESGDPGAVLIAENRARLQAAIAQAKGD